jgi:hypothetical protein
MPELEESLRSEVARRMEGFEASADLPARIRTQVRRRHRQRQAMVGIASLGALAMVVAVGVIVLSPGNAVEISDPAPPDATDPTGPVDVAEPFDAPGRRTGTTEPREAPTPTLATTPGTEGPTGTTVLPGTTAPPGSTGTTTVTTVEIEGGPLKPPDSQEPSGPCPPAAEIVLGPEGPSPPCSLVTSDQRLQVRNDTDHQVTVSVGGFVSDTVEPDESAVIGGEFVGYLEPGVHIVDVSPYDPGQPEIWFVP